MAHVFITSVQEYPKLIVIISYQYYAALPPTPCSTLTRILNTTARRQSRYLDNDSRGEDYFNAASQAFINTQHTRTLCPATMNLVLTG